MLSCFKCKHEINGQPAYCCRIDGIRQAICRWCYVQALSDWLQQKGLK